MTCARIRKVILQSDVSAFPQDVIDHARQCPRCGQVLQRTRTVAHLVHLKVYEQPAPGAQGRCLAEVRDRIAIQQSWQQQGERSVGVGVGWRFGFAAACVILIGFNVITSSRLPTAQPLVGDAQSDSYRSFEEAVMHEMAGRDPLLDNLFASNSIHTIHKVPEPLHSLRNVGQYRETR